MNCSLKLPTIPSNQAMRDAVGDPIIPYLTQSIFRLAFFSVLLPEQHLKQSHVKTILVIDHPVVIILS
jgi:hypothetical protein